MSTSLSYKVCAYEKVYNFLDSYSSTRRFYDQLQLLRVEAQKWSNIKQPLSTAETQIDPRLKQLRLKLTSQRATLLVDQY